MHLLASPLRVLQDTRHCRCHTDHLTDIKTVLTHCSTLDFAFWDQKWDVELTWTESFAHLSPYKGSCRQSTPPVSPGSWGHSSGHFSATVTGNPRSSWVETQRSVPSVWGVQKARAGGSTGHCHVRCHGTHPSTASCNGNGTGFFCHPNCHSSHFPPLHSMTSKNNYHPTCHLQRLK